MHYMHREHAMTDQHTHAARDRVGIEKQSVSTLGVSEILHLKTLVCTPSLIEQQNTHARTNPQSSPHCCSRPVSLLEMQSGYFPLFYALLTESRLKKSRSGYCDDRRKGNPWSLKVHFWKGMSEIMTVG